MGDGGTNGGTRKNNISVYSPAKEVLQGLRVLLSGHKTGRIVTDWGGLTGFMVQPWNGAVRPCTSH